MYDAVEVAAVYDGVQQLGFVTMEQRYAEALYGDLSEAVVDGTVFCLCEPQFKKFMVTVVVAKYADKGAVELFEFSYSEG